MKTIIFGVSDFSRLLYWFLKNDTDKDVIYFTCHQKYMTDDNFCDLPVIPFEKLGSLEFNFEILIAVGYSKMNDVRTKIFNECKEKGYKIGSYIHSSALVDSTQIGEGNIIMQKSIIYPFAKIGDNNLFWDNVVINHDCVVGSHNTFAGNSDLNGYVKIGNNTFIGKKAIIKEHVIIADYTLIGAGAFCAKNSKEYDVIVPCRSYKLTNKKSIEIM